MTKVDADARPGAGAAAHGVDEDVIHFQHLGRIRMTLLPTLQSRERVFLVLRLRRGDQRLR